MKKIILLSLCVCSLSLAQTKIPLNNILESYLNIKNAFVASDANLVSQKAHRFIKLLDSITIEGSNNSLDSTWLIYENKITTDAKHIYETKKIDHQREHFNSFSKNLFNVFKITNTNEIQIYQQFCPMADDGKGAYWMSEFAAIKNPYFGKSMLNCGKTISILNAKKSQ